MREVDGGNNDKATVGFGEIWGSVAFPFANGFIVALDADIRHDRYRKSSDFDDDEDPDFHFGGAVHALYNFTPDSRGGVFVSYNDTRSQGDPVSDAYNVWIVGLEGQSFIADNVMVYGQIGYGFKGRDGQDDDEGFNKGIAARAGAFYFMTDRTTLNLDVEFAGSENYIDSSDPGRFFGATLGGETQVAQNSPWFVNYYARYDHINSTDEGDHLDEWQIGLGVKYVFGASSAREAARRGKSIGTPRMPVRASAWTEYID